MSKKIVTVRVAKENAELAVTMTERVFSDPNMSNVAYEMATALAATAYGALRLLSEKSQGEYLDLIINRIYEDYAYIRIIETK